MATGGVLVTSVAIFLEVLFSEVKTFVDAGLVLAFEGNFGAAIFFANVFFEAARTGFDDLFAGFALVRLATLGFAFPDFTALLRAAAFFAGALVRVAVVADRLADFDFFAVAIGVTLTS
ncbi:MAG: hypothetical protein ACHQNE_07800 [Candidatus Kapaibacterium sp.]